MRTGAGAGNAQSNRIWVVVGWKLVMIHHRRSVASHLEPPAGCSDAAEIEAAVPAPRGCEPFRFIPTSCRCCRWVCCSAKWASGGGGLGTWPRW